jgi:thiol-disulfide isomerase/thioredoxin
MTCLSPLPRASLKQRTFSNTVSLTIACLLGLPAAWFPELAQDRPALPGCEAPAPLQKELNAELYSTALDSMKTSRMARQVEMIDEFIAKYPREAEPYRKLIDLTWVHAALIPILVDRFEKQAKSNPDDPLAQALLGYSLTLADPQRGIQELSDAKAKAPAFPLPYLLLAEIYSLGKSADHKAMTDNITGYFNLCPASTDSEAQRLLAKTEDKALQAKVATALRARLEKETEDWSLKSYETLWALEFRIRPPQEHATLRRQVTADLKRVENLNRKPDAKFEAFLVRVYKQSDAPGDKSKAWEDRLIKEYPKSEEGAGAVQSRWYKAHEMPEDQRDRAAWTKWEQEHKAALREWIREFPDDYYLQHYAWANAIVYDESLSEKEVLQAFEVYLEGAEQGWSTDAYIAAAEFLLRHKVQPRRALDALHQAETELAKQHSEAALNKNRTEQDEKEQRDREGWQRISIARQTLEAARQLGDTAVTQPLRAEVEGPPFSEKLLSYYWLNRAKLAVVENRKADALVYCQLAYKTRKDPPEWRHGKFYDELADDARPLWKELGGTEAAFDIWSKPAKPEELAEGRWEKPAKPLPEFELVDMSGKTWRLKELRGKAVLINVWATWCGPCQAELPHIQKLYDRLRDSADLLVLTLNIDEDLGAVEPYLKEKGYGFPVLPAYGFVSNVVDSSIGIPQTWIVDSKGQWQWTQVGFGAVTDWEETVTNKLRVAEAVN